MSFSRHEQIYRSDGGKDKAGHGPAAASRAHRSDEFAAGYSLAGCAPAEPAYASPAADEYATTVGKRQCFSSEWQPVPYFVASPNDRTAASGTRKLGTSDVACVSRRAVSPFLATCLCWHHYSTPLSPPGQSVSDKNKQNLTKNSHFVRQYDTGPAAALNANH